MILATSCEQVPDHYEAPTLTDSAEVVEPEPPVSPPSYTPSDSTEDAAREAAPDDRVRQAIALLSGTAGHESLRGVVNLTETTPGEVIVSVELEGLPPESRHGFHIHQKGDCSAADASSAGDHFAPEGHAHALPPTERHAGDMGNVTADDRGRVEAARTFESFSLQPDAPRSVIGRAIILHAEPDDGQGDSGHAGARIACGVIGRR